MDIPKQSSGFMVARVMTSFMPEKLILDKAIEALIDYRDEKFNSDKKTEKDSLDSIKEFLASTGQGSSSSVEEIDSKIPKAQISALLMKWEDLGKTMETIMAECKDFDQFTKGMGSNDES